MGRNLLRDYKICASIIANDPELIRRQEPEVDLWEVRMDLIGRDWPQLSGILAKPWIACNRSPREGGQGPQDEKIRLLELIRGIEAGAAIVDIELAAEGLQKIVQLSRNTAKVLVSYHNFSETPAYGDLADIVKRQIESGADICKVVTTAHSVSDNITILRLVNEFKNVAIVAFAMGKEGHLSRVLAPLAGAEFTYASLGTGLEAASGQLTVSELRAIMKLTG